MKYKNVFFDLDGTLLDTLGDIVKAVNRALKEQGYDRVHTYESGKALIGNGAKVLVTRSLEGFNYTSEQFDSFFLLFKKYYELYQKDTTKPFDGVLDMLADLKKRGHMLFIFSNKPAHLLTLISDKCFPKGLFSEEIGHREGYKAKPDPTGINEIIEKYKLNRNECVYVGDSIVDIETAKNANIDCCLVTYGYSNYTTELKEKATYVANSPSEIKNLL